MNHQNKSLNQLLMEAGVFTHYNDGKNKPGTHIEFDGKVIERPKHNHLYNVVLREFSIDLTTFNN